MHFFLIFEISDDKSWSFDDGWFWWIYYCICKLSLLLCSLIYQFLNVFSISDMVFDVVWFFNNLFNNLFLSQYFKSCFWKRILTSTWIWACIYFDRKDNNNINNQFYWILKLPNPNGFPEAETFFWFVPCIVSIGINLFWRADSTVKGRFWTLGSLLKFYFLIVSKTFFCISLHQIIFLKWQAFGQ